MKQPFLFLGQGLSMSHRFSKVFIVFENKPNPQQFKLIKELIPEPLRREISFDPLHIFSCGCSADEARLRVTHFYNKKYQNIPWEKAIKTFKRKPKDLVRGYYNPTPLEWKKFSKDIENSLMKIHEVCPIKFALRASDGPSKYGTWNNWSIKNISPVLEFFSKLKKPASRVELVFANQLVYDILEKNLRGQDTAHYEMWILWISRLLKANSEFSFNLASFGAQIWQTFDAKTKSQLAKKVSAAQRMSFDDLNE